MRAQSVENQRLQGLTSESPEVLDILKNRFGFKNLRPGQHEVIDAALAGENLLVVMPTGAGKSLCFQLPALVLPGTTLVISPLIALMKDQKQKLDNLKIETLELNSHITASDQEQNIEVVKSGATDFLYVTPEKFASSEFQKSIKKLQIDLLVIDEAHCISQWGHDFRPAYLQISEGWKAIGRPQVLALTATATTKVIEDIKVQLELPRMKVISQGIMRENLFYSAHVLDHESEKLDKIKELLSDLSGPAIIYSATVKNVDTLYEELSDSNFEVYKYHGKMKAEDRTDQRTGFMASSEGIMIATNAFGMGIDKSNIRTLIHMHFPGSLEAYYQESGRAGRDGETSNCVLLYLKKDKATQAFFNSGKYPSFDNLKKIYELLQTQFLKTQAVNLDKVLEIDDIPKAKASTLVSLLKKQDIIRLKNRKWTLHVPNLSQSQLQQIFQIYAQKKELDAEKLKEMIRYSQTALCRWEFILDYFDDSTAIQTCGHCDNCLKGTADLAASPLH